MGDKWLAYDCGAYELEPTQIEISDWMTLNIPSSIWGIWGEHLGEVIPFGSANPEHFTLAKDADRKLEQSLPMSQDDHDGFLMSKAVSSMWFGNPISVETQKFLEI